MRVAICRLFNNGNVAKKPVVKLNATNLDTAEEWFNNNERRRYPEHWNWCYVNLDYKNPRKAHK